MKKYIVIASALALSACAAENQLATSALTGAGASASTAARVVAIGNTVGQLSCYAAKSGWFQVVGANVVGASAAAVQAACAVADPDSVPGALPADVVPTVKVVSDVVLAKLNDSKP